MSSRRSDEIALDALTPFGDATHRDRGASTREPTDEREVVRRKTFALSALTPERAALDMCLQDFDFHLFTNSDTCEEDVVHRRPDGTTALMQITATLDENPPFAADPVSAPVLLVDGAGRRAEPDQASEPASGADVAQAYGVLAPRSGPSPT